MPSAEREVFWADAEARLLAPGVAHVIRDSKTPSGVVPISGLRGPIITDALYRTFKRRGLPIRYVFTIDDYDPMDSQSMRSREGMTEQMGKPLCAIPSPDGSASSFARYHAERFLSMFAGLGIRPDELHWMSDLYRGGKLDRSIRLVLDHAGLVREIYARVSNVKKDERWLPVMPICERCGRIGTTYATDWDGETVAYACRPDYVEWAEGCGTTGRISPFAGNAKLPWNLQWCAQWDLFGVTYEEGGKDLLTGGGSRDRSNELYRAIWKHEPPLGLQHEFLNIGGKKMGTSTGIGAAATDLVQVYPGELVRFLMLRTHPKRHIEFDPAGSTLPALMDEYDRCENAYVAAPESDFGKAWRLSQLSDDVAPIAFRVRFALVADWLQIPSIDPLRQAERKKGAPLTAEEHADLERRIELARVWLDRWAPDEAKFSVRAELPAEARELSPGQRAFLARAAEEIGALAGAEALQTKLYDLAKEVGLVDGGKVSRDAFASIYIAFLGKPSGPRAAWLLVTLDPAFVGRRLREAAEATA